MSVYDEILEKKKQDRIKYRLEQEERDNEDLKRKNDVYATKFYSMQKQIDNKDKEIERLKTKEEQLIRRLEDLIIVGEQVENEWAIDICKMVINELKGSDIE